jgi:hypothetical protein
LGVDLDDTLNEIVRRGSEDIEDSVDTTCRKLDKIVDAWGKFSSEEDLISDLNKELNVLITRIMKRRCKDISRDAKLKVKHTLDSFFSDAEEQLGRLSAPDFDPRLFVKNVSSKFSFDNDDDTLFTFTDDKESVECGWFDIVFEMGEAFIKGATFGVSEKLTNFLTHGEKAREYHNKITEMSGNFKANIYLGKILSSKDKVISEVKKAFIDELLLPLQAQLDEIRQTGIDKEKKLIEANSRVDSLKTQKTVMEANIKQIQDLVNI